MRPPISPRRTLYWLGEDVLQPADAPPLTRAIWRLGAPPVGSAASCATPTVGSDRDAYMIGAGDSGSSEHTRAPPAVLYAPAVSVLPAADRFPALALGPPAVRRTDWAASAACGALEPTIFGHGVLINSDVPAAFGALWFAYAAWKYWCTPNLPRIADFCRWPRAVAVLIKFTLLPLAAAGSGWLSGRARACGAIAIPLAVYVGILAASQFQAQPVPPVEIQQFSGAGVPHWALPGVKLLARAAVAAPIRRAACCSVGGSLQGDGFTGYMLGHKIQVGFRSVFRSPGDQVPNPPAVAHRGWTDRSWHSDSAA